MIFGLAQNMNGKNIFDEEVLTMTNHEKLVDAILAKISEESKDFTSYEEMAEMSDSSYVKKLLLKIASEEKQHHDYLVQVLAMLAKNTVVHDEEVKKDVTV